MLTFTKTHEAAMAAKDAEIAGVSLKLHLTEERVDGLTLDNESLRDSAFGADRTAALYKRLYEGACKTLGQIAGQETPIANATVKRMARMARAELPVLHHTAAAVASAAEVL